MERGRKSEEGRERRRQGETVRDTQNTKYPSHKRVKVKSQQFEHLLYKLPQIHLLALLLKYSRKLTHTETIQEAS